MIPLYQLDNQKHYDHTAAVFLPGVDYLHRARHTFEDLERIVSRLRAPDGCPWDSVQTHRSLTPYMVEEAWEVVNAIEEDDPDHLADELGDVLFQVFIHASIGKSCGEFTLTDILTDICRKMIHRHPAVFDENRRPEDPAAMKSCYY
jgi:tetrapyrrole methylase family protein/MazG family protein